MVYTDRTSNESAYVARAYFLNTGSDNPWNAYYRNSVSLQNVFKTKRFICFWLIRTKKSWKKSLSAKNECRIIGWLQTLIRAVEFARELISTFYLLEITQNTLQKSIMPKIIFTVLFSIILQEHCGCLCPRWGISVWQTIPQCPAENWRKGKEL